MYGITKWLDKIVDAETGELIQQGTDQSAANFNNMENGIHDAHVAAALTQIAVRLIESSIHKIEVIEEMLLAGEKRTLPYPEGFTKDNCVLLSVMGTGDGVSWTVNANASVDVSLISDGISVTNKTSYAYDHKVVLCKYK